jgi:adenylate cyclase, class 2
MNRKADTHRETEVKLAIRDLPGLIEKLRALGIKARGRVFESNTLFDTDGSDLRNRGRLLRLRTEVPAPTSWAPGGPKQSILTAKSPAPPSIESGRSARYKHNMEREVSLPPAKGGKRSGKRTLVDRGWPFALGCLGLRSKFRYEKYRTAFQSKGVHLDLDETPVGTFLELEGKPEAIDRIAHSLGFTPRDYMRATYYDIYAAERRKKGRPVRNMLF